MYLKSIGLLVLLVITGLVAPVSLADSPGARTIANILYDFNHFPADAAKKSLLRIAQDPGSSEEERVVALALSRVEHKVKGEDVTALQKVIESDSVSDQMRILARILLHLNHKPSDEDLATIKAML